MTDFRAGDFDVAALYAALDAERSSRGMTWAEATRAINAQFKDVPARPISVSTVTGMRTRRALEGDGVLQMLLWLGRAPESFMPGREGVSRPEELLPRVGPDRILRFDSPALYAALDAERIERYLRWHQVAREIGGITAIGLQPLEKGGRVSFPGVMRMVRWLGRPAASFTRASYR